VMQAPRPSAVQIGSVTPRSTRVVGSACERAIVVARSQHDRVVPVQKSWPGAGASRLVFRWGRRCRANSCDSELRSAVCCLLSCCLMGSGHGPLLSSRNHRDLLRS